MDKEKKVKERVIDSLGVEIPMKKEIKEEVIQVIEKSRKENKDLEIVRELKLQYSKQFFIRFPRDIERVLGLKQGKKAKFIIKIPPRGTKRKIDIKLEIENGERV